MLRLRANAYCVGEIVSVVTSAPFPGWIFAAIRDELHEPAHRFFMRF